MSIALLVVFAAVAAAQDAEPRPTGLIAKLGSAQPAERAAAAASLRALGRRALPALQKAIKAGDGELAKLASAVRDTIDGDLLKQPSMVELAGRNRPITEVVEELGKQTGLTLQVDQGSQRGVVGLSEQAPIPFWTALERLGLKGVYHRNPGKGKFPQLDLHNDPMWTFTSTAGPFRVSLTGLHLHRDRQLIRGPWVRIDRFGQRIGVADEAIKGDVVTFFGGLEVMVEPRMWFTQEAPARLTEATDDVGQSLVPEGAGLATSLSDDAHFAFYPGNGVTDARAEFRLRATERSGRVARLRGFVPVMLHVRRAEPMLKIPLSGAPGQTFRCDDARFTVDTVNDSPTATNIAGTFQLNVAKADLPEKPERELITSRLRVMTDHQLELTDAAGTVVADSIGSGYSSGDTPTVYHFTMNSSGNGRATHLRYYSMLRVRAEAAFDFRDVPLP